MSRPPTDLPGLPGEGEQRNRVAEQLTFLAYVAYAISQQRSDEAFDETTFIYDSDVLLIWSDPSSETARRYFRKILKEKGDQEAIAYWAMLESMRKDSRRVYLMAPEHYQELIASWAALLSDMSAGLSEMERRTRPPTGPAATPPAAGPITVPGDRQLGPDDALELLRSLASDKLRTDVDRSRRLRMLMRRTRSLAQEPDRRFADVPWPRRDDIYGDERYREWLTAIRAARGHRERADGLSAGSDWDFRSPIDPSWNDVFDARVLRALEQTNEDSLTPPLVRAKGHRLVLVTGSPTMHLATSRMPAPKFLGDRAKPDDSFGFHFVWDVCRQVTRLALARSDQSVQADGTDGGPRPVELLDFFSETARKFEDITRNARDRRSSGVAAEHARPLSGLLLELSLWRAFHRGPDKPGRPTRLYRDAEVDTIVDALQASAGYGELSDKYEELSQRWGTLFRTEAVDTEIRREEHRRRASLLEDPDAARRRLSELVDEARSELISSFVAVAYLNLSAARATVGPLYRTVPADLVDNGLAELGLGREHSTGQTPSLATIEAYLARFEVVHSDDKRSQTPQFYVEFALICAWLFNDWALAARFAEHARYLLGHAALDGTKVVDASLLALYCRRHAVRGGAQLAELERAVRQLATEAPDDLRPGVELSALKVAMLSFIRFRRRPATTPASAAAVAAEDEQRFREAFEVCRGAYAGALQAEPGRPYRGPALVRAAMHQLLLLVIAAEGLAPEPAFSLLGTDRPHLEQVLRVGAGGLAQGQLPGWIAPAVPSVLAREDPPEMLAVVWTAELLLRPDAIGADLLRRRREELERYTTLQMSLPYDVQRLRLMIAMHDAALGRPAAATGSA